MSSFEIITLISLIFELNCYSFAIVGCVDHDEGVHVGGHLRNVQVGAPLHQIS